MGLVAAQHQLLGWQGYGSLWGMLGTDFMDDLAPDQDWAHSTHGSEMSQANGDAEAGVLEHHCGNTPASQLVTSFGPSQKYFRNISFPSAPACLWHT